MTIKTQKLEFLSKYNIIIVKLISNRYQPRKVKTTILQKKG